MLPNPQFQEENFFVQLAMPKRFFQMNPWQHLKKSLEQIHSYDDTSFLDPKWHIGPKGDFFIENSTKLILK